MQEKFYSLSFGLYVSSFPNKTLASPTTKQQSGYKTWQAKEKCCCFSAVENPVVSRFCRSEQMSIYRDGHAISIGYFNSSYRNRSKPEPIWKESTFIHVLFHKILKCLLQGVSAVTGHRTSLSNSNNAVAGNTRTVSGRIYVACLPVA
jgi:hypothetical protein